MGACYLPAADTHRSRGYVLGASPLRAYTALFLTLAQLKILSLL